MTQRLRAGLIGAWVAGAVKVGACLISAAIAAAFLLHVFGARELFAAARSANVSLLVGAVGMGALIQIVRAQRSRYLLAQYRRVSLFHSYAAMVVGHGLGDLVPVAPGGPVLRSVLTERLTGAPIAFSGGVYIVEGMLDVIAPAVLIPYLLFRPSLPSWVHWVLMGVAIQAALLVALLAMLAVCSHTQLRPWRVRMISSPRLEQMAHQLVEGLHAVTAGGLRRCVSIVGLSLLLIALTAGQLSLFLHAFTLSAPVSGLLLLLVVVLSAGSVPLKIPAFGTLSAAAVLPVAGIHGLEVGGYLLISQFLLSSETAGLAALVLGWWFVRGIQPLGTARSEDHSSESSMGDARQKQESSPTIDPRVPWPATLHGAADTAFVSPTP